MNVFVDTNVLLDVLARREPHYADSAQVWTLAETGRIDGQFFCAVRAGATALITRNPKDYPGDDLAIQTPAEFLATHFQE